MKARNYILLDVSCSHCKDKIERELGKMDGVRSVVVNIDSKEAEIKYESPATGELIKTALSDIGYPACL